jgi:cell wall-associated NlpC family hydrolase
VPSAVHLRNIVLLPLLTLAVVAAMSLLAPAPDASAASRAKRVDRAAGVALKQIGDPYRYGAAGPRAFDCSGLVQYSFRKAGIRLPRTSRAQAQRAHRISKKKLRRGDLMFFHNGGRVYHAAIFVKRTKGRVLMVHSPGSGKRVQRAHPWTNRWFAASVRR